MALHSTGLDHQLKWLPLSAGHQAIEYFTSLSTTNEVGTQQAEPLQEGSNEAEWIVDVTTQADRQGRQASVFEWMNVSILALQLLHDGHVGESALLVEAKCLFTSSCSL